MHSEKECETEPLNYSRSSFSEHLCPAQAKSDQIDILNATTFISNENLALTHTQMISKMKME